MEKSIPAKRMFHDWSWGRAKHLWFWQGQIICRLFGHRISNDASLPSCGRCRIALEEIYGLDFYRHYTVIPNNYGLVEAAARKLLLAFPRHTEGQNLVQFKYVPGYIVTELEKALES